ncbi:hypothetical protein MWU54_10150 [Marivita sp. S6314]|uniref:hypothetical protein n=1 Tax=Marivita sp. S6314 TaxID=2926406 RepID=UPI001FF16942|nr:hypothetical protein [Marivita sp. S6314]MCK0150385.1 hypothetical protein [Marivita sp. S6314]
MKVTRDTDTQLILANTPWLLSLGLVLFMLVFVGAGVLRMSDTLLGGMVMLIAGSIGGAVFLLAFVRRTQLILDRHSGLVTLRRRSLLGYSEKTFDLDDLSHAVTQDSRSKNNSGTRRAALMFHKGPDKGTHPITIVYTNTKGPVRAVDAINRWMERHRTPDTP